MGYVKGSHRGPTYAPKNLLTTAETQTMTEYMPKGVQLLPNIEANEKDYDVIYHEAKPGDVVIHHVNTIHGSAGNTSLERSRRAASIRYVGDDVVFAPNKVDPVLGGRAYDPMSKGEADATRTSWAKTEAGGEFEGGLYPQVWPRLTTAKL